jgi:hypothetical protein
MNATGSAFCGIERRPFLRRIRVSSTREAWARASVSLFIPSERLNDRPPYRKRTKKCSEASSKSDRTTACVELDRSNGKTAIYRLDELTRIKEGDKKRKR